MITSVFAIVIYVLSNKIDLTDKLGTYGFWILYILIIAGILFGWYSFFNKK